MNRRPQTVAALLHFIRLCTAHIADVRRMRQSAVEDARYYGASEEQIEGALHEADY